MSSSYLDAALRFTRANEGNELNDESGLSSETCSSNSFRSYVERKVAILSRASNDQAMEWRNAIEAGIRYVQSGQIDALSIEEELDVWRELARRHGWPPAP